MNDDISGSGNCLIGSIGYAGFDGEALVRIILENLGWHFDVKLPLGIGDTLAAGNVRWRESAREKALVKYRVAAIVIEIPEAVTPAALIIKVVGAWRGQPFDIRILDRPPEKVAAIYRRFYGVTCDHFSLIGGYLDLEFW